MKRYLPAALSCCLGLATGFLLGNWYADESRTMSATTVAVAAQPTGPLHALALAQAASVDCTAEDFPRTGLAHVYALMATDPGSALEAATKLSGSTRLATMQSLMAAWLRTDRLAAAEWMTKKQGLQEFEPLSAQVSDAFFPDDTEMSAMFSFNLTDASLREARVNRLVAHWRSGAHLKFENSPWEVDGPGNRIARPAPEQPAPSSPTESPAAPSPQQAAADTSSRQTD